MIENTIAGDDLDRIGRLGENHFERMCEKSKLKWSKVEPDRTGKDYIVEFNLEPDRVFTSVDRRSPPIQIVVQVKTILAKNDKASVALSVLERLAKDTRPAVIAIHQIDDNDEIVGLYFLHLIDETLGRVLKALRRASTRPGALHKKSMTFKIRQAQSIASKQAEFYSAIASLPDGDMLDYATRKISQIDTLGFDANRHSMKFTLTASPEDIADGFLALKPLQVENVVFSERRFNIDLPVEAVARATLELLPTTHMSGTCLLQTYAPDIVRQCEIAANFTYVPEPLLGKGQFALSARTKQGVFVVRPGSWSFKQAPEFGPDNEHNLQDWKDYVELGAIMGTASFSIAFRANNNDGSAVFKVTEPAAAYDIEAEKQYLFLLGLLEGVFGPANLSTALFKLTEIVSHRKHLNLIVKTLAGVVATFESSSSDPAIPALESESGALVCPVNILGQWIGYFMAIAVTTNTGSAGTRWIGKQTRRAVVEKLSPEDVEGSFEAFRAKYCDLLGANIAFVQKPGEFMTGDMGLMDLRSDHPSQQLSPTVNADQKEFSHEDRP